MYSMVTIVIAYLKVDLKSPHHKKKKPITMYDDRCQLDLLWDRFTMYANIESLRSTFETNML